MNKVNLKATILIPLGVSLCILLGTFFFSIYTRETNELSEHVERELLTVDRLFEKQVDSEVELLKALIELLEKDISLQYAWSAKDRKELLRLTLPTMKNFHDKHNITHFYFHDINRVNFLRVHKPEKHGDIIDRYTMKKTQETGQTTVGFELGTLGTFTLRIVSPWKINGKVIGYIELGEEIDHFIGKLHKILDLNIVVSIYKKYLNREKWAEGMDLLGHKGNWDQLPDAVIISKTFEEIPTGLGSLLSEGAHDYMERTDDFELIVEGKKNQVGVIPLFDTENHEVGDIVVLYDVTAELAETKNSILIVFSIIVLVGVVLFVLFSIILGRVEKELEKHRKHLHDMVEKRTAELARSEERYRSLVENTNLGISLIDTDRNILMVNAAHAKLLNKTPDDVIGKKCFTEFENQDVPCKNCPGTKAMLTKLPQETETESILKDGTRIPILKRAYPIFDPSKKPTGFIEVVEDITERKKTEEEKQKLQVQLFQSQKMESVGRLAGGIAHDFNNILCAINGYAELALMELDKDDPSRKDFSAILTAGKKAARLTQQLLAFSRKQIINQEILNLNTTIENIQQMLKKLIGEGIEIEIFTNDQLWNIKSDHSQLEQVIMNLAVNASDAMPMGGKLTIETENVVIEEGYALEHYEVNPGEYVLFAFSDTGCGFTEEEKGQIFEPFFTTKEKGKGTGLGLATVYGIIKQNNGFINVYSEPGEGTTFKLYLPRTEEEVPIIEEKQSEGIPRGSETILLVEDEKEVRDVIVKMLSKLGYLVLEAEEGEDALNICKKYHGDVHLLLTDVVMPKMSGSELATQVKGCCPKTRVLYMSGYTENAIVHHGVLENGVNFIKKPITNKSLAQAVRKALDKDKPKHK